MKVITNNERVATEVLSSQGLFNSDIPEITIRSIGSPKHFINDYDAEIIIQGIKIVLFRDLNFQNVKIKDLLTADLSNIEFVKLIE